MQTMATGGHEMASAVVAANKSLLRRTARTSTARAAPRRAASAASPAPSLSAVMPASASAVSRTRASAAAACARRAAAERPRIHAVSGTDDSRTATPASAAWKPRKTTRK